jgi:hypothetical protein
MRIDSSGNVGIGTSSPATKFNVSDSSTNCALTVTNSSSNFQVQSNSNDGYVNLNGSGNIIFRNGTPSVTERMRLTSGGSLVVGNTTDGIDSNGQKFRSDGQTFLVITDATPLTLNRYTSDGNLIDLRHDGTSVGSISSNAAGGITIGGTGDVVRFSAHPTSTLDNFHDVGTLAIRWDDIYATNGTIQTSDANEKQDIEALSEAETRVAVAAKSLLKKYRWKSAVAEKGDDARIHFGIIAQDLKAAFEAEGLDAGRYAMFIKGEWWEHEVEVPAVEAQEAVYETQTDEEGNEVQVLVSEAVEGKDAYTRTDTYDTEAEAPEGAVRKERMGIRYNELLAFMVAAL